MGRNGALPAPAASTIAARPHEVTKSRSVACVGRPHRRSEEAWPLPLTNAGERSPCGCSLRRPRRFPRPTSEAREELQRLARPLLFILVSVRRLLPCTRVLAKHVPVGSRIVEIYDASGRRIGRESFP